MTTFSLHRIFQAAEKCSIRTGARQASCVLLLKIKLLHPACKFCLWELELLPASNPTLCMLTGICIPSGQFSGPELDHCYESLYFLRQCFGMCCVKG